MMEMIAQGKNIRIRPTMGMVLNAVMSSLGSVNGLRVLDLYAGTGTYGLRALELGAVRADFVERSTKFCDKLREKLEERGWKSASTVWRGSVSRLIYELPGEYDVVFVDPPYDVDCTDLLDQALGKLPKLINEDGVIVIEHSSRKELTDSLGDFRRVKEKRYGDTATSMYRRELKKVV